MQGIRDYLLTLIKPELAVMGKFIAKQPSYISIPTSNVCFKEQLNIQLTSANDFYLFWIPNFFTTSISLDKHIEDFTGSTTVKNYSHLYYTIDGFKYYLHTSYVPKINLAKYRLVSAKCSLQYNGNIMNQQGQFHSCAIYNDLPVFLMRSGTIIENYEISKTNMDTVLGQTNALAQYCDLELVRNGLWNKYINITTNSRSLENIALPTDPTDHTFYPMSHYYAQEPKRSEQIANIYYATSSDGGHLSYLYTCQNMNTENAYVTVILYYNFEVIADQSTAPFLRSKRDESEAKILNALKNTGAMEKIMNAVANKNIINIGNKELMNIVLETLQEILPKNTNINNTGLSRTIIDNAFKDIKNKPIIEHRNDDMSFLDSIVL